MLIVMLILLMGTATAIFAIHSTTTEMRAAGYGRQAVQTQYVAEAGLVSSLALVDQLGPQSIIRAMEQSAAPPMAAFGEPELLTGKRGYRIYIDDITSTTGLATTIEPTNHDVLGVRQAYDPRFIVDVNDDYTYEGVVAGERADGGGSVRFMVATYTSRGRTVVSGGDSRTTGGGITDTRDYHEGANDSRAYGVSGPFGR